MAVLLVTAVLDWRDYAAGIGDLAVTGDESRLRELAIHGLVEMANQILSLQPISPFLHCLGIRNSTAVLQPRETLKTGPIQYLILQGLIRQVIQLLQHQKLDDQFGRKRRASVSALIAGHPLHVDSLGQRSKVDRLAQYLERITQPLTFFLPLLDCKQTDHRQLTGAGSKSIR